MTPNPSYLLLKLILVIFKVFKMLWTEPQGQGGSSSTVDTNSYVEIESKYGQKAYHSIRRFIIVRAMKGHSVCV